MLSIKSELEEKLKILHGLHMKYGTEKEKVISEMKLQHDHAMNELRKSLESKENGSLRMHALEEDYAKKLETLQQQITAIRTEKQQQATEYEDKLKKTQTFYEKELQALKETKASLDNDKIAALKDAAEMAKKDYVFRVRSCYQAKLIIQY